jgi:tRNA threonylcarbamoyl adenosine modification protein YeaZ
MTILAIEFSSPLRSVAISDHGQIVAQSAEQSDRETNAFGLIDASLRAAGVRRETVDCIAVGLGPGSYAGIRIAIAVAQGWNLAAGTRIVGYSSADCVVHQAKAEGEITVVIDAQRGEFFGARYRKASAKIDLVEPFRLLTDADWRREEDGEVFLRPDTLENGPTWSAAPPDAATLAQLAAGALGPKTSLPLVPIYLRMATFVKAPLPAMAATLPELK